MLKPKKLMAGFLAAAMTVSLAVPAMAAENTTSDTTTEAYSVYLSVDPTIVDSADFVVDAVKIDVPKGTEKTVTLGDLVLDELDDLGIGYTGSASYISGIQCAASTSFTLPASVSSKLPSAALDRRIMVLPGDTSVPAGYLVEKEFTGYAGWMMTLDNATKIADSTQYGGYYYYYLGSTIAEMEKYGIFDDDTAVLQMFFSFDMGADIGMGTQYLPTDITYYTDANGNNVYYYDWNSENTQTVSSFTRADSTALVAAMADYTQKNDAKYRYAKQTLKNLNSTSARIAAAVNQLK